MMSLSVAEESRPMRRSYDVKTTSESTTSRWVLASVDELSIDLS
jgi:hypothetical protein